MIFNNYIIFLVFIITSLSLTLHLVLIPIITLKSYDYYSSSNNHNDFDILKNEIEWLSNDQRKRFEDIRSNKLTSSQIEIVLARYKEDISWSNIYKNIVTVYDKSEIPLPLYRSSIYNKYITLNNIGREAHSYLYHIVNNYDKLADVTVFSQGSEPTKGYRGHRLGGGHLLQNISFHDYVLQPEGLFIFTGAIFIPTSAHIMRKGYTSCADNEAHRIGPRFGTSNSRLVSAASDEMNIKNRKLRGSFDNDAVSIPMIDNNLDIIFYTDDDDHNANDIITIDDYKSQLFTPYPICFNMSESFETFSYPKDMINHIADRCIADAAISCGGFESYDKIVQLSRPSLPIAFFAQGAVFSVSKSDIHKRPLSYYQDLMEATSVSNDPSISYFLEWYWYYVLTSNINPCDHVDANAFRFTAYEYAFSHYDFPRRREHMNEQRYYYYYYYFIINDVYDIIIIIRVRAEKKS